MKFITNLFILILISSRVDVASRVFHNFSKKIAFLAAKNLTQFPSAEKRNDGPDFVAKVLIPDVNPFPLTKQFRPITTEGAKERTNALSIIYPKVFENNSKKSTKRVIKEKSPDAIPDDIFTVTVLNSEGEEVKFEKSSLEYFNNVFLDWKKLISDNQVEEARNSFNKLCKTLFDNGMSVQIKVEGREPFVLSDNLIDNDSETDPKNISNLGKEFTDKFLAILDQPDSQDLSPNSVSSPGGENEPANKQSTDGSCPEQADNGEGKANNIEQGTGATDDNSDNNASFEVNTNTVDDSNDQSTTIAEESEAINNDAVADAEIVGEAEEAVKAEADAEAVAEGEAEEEAGGEAGAEAVAEAVGEAGADAGADSNGEAGAESVEGESNEEITAGEAVADAEEAESVNVNTYVSDDLDDQSAANGISTSVSESDNHTVQSAAIPKAICPSAFVPISEGQKKESTDVDRQKSGEIDRSFNFAEMFEKAADVNAAVSYGEESAESIKDGKLSNPDHQKLMHELLALKKKPHFVNNNSIRSSNDQILDDEEDEIINAAVVEEVLGIFMFETVSSAGDWCFGKYGNTRNSTNTTSSKPQSGTQPWLSYSFGPSSQKVKEPVIELAEMTNIRADGKEITDYESTDIDSSSPGSDHNIYSVRATQGTFDEVGVISDNNLTVTLLNSEGDEVKLDKSSLENLNKVLQNFNLNRLMGNNQVDQARDIFNNLWKQLSENGMSVQINVEGREPFVLSNNFIVGADHKNISNLGKGFTDRLFTILDQPKNQAVRLAEDGKSLKASGNCIEDVEGNLHANSLAAENTGSISSSVIRSLNMASSSGEGVSRSTSSTGSSTMSSLAAENTGSSASSSSTNTSSSSGRGTIQVAPSANNPEGGASASAGAVSPNAGGEGDLNTTSPSSLSSSSADPDGAKTGKGTPFVPPVKGTSPIPAVLLDATKTRPRWMNFSTILVLIVSVGCVAGVAFFVFKADDGASGVEL